MSLCTRCNRLVFTTPPPPRVFPADGFLSVLIKSVFIFISVYSNERFSFREHVFVESRSINQSPRPTIFVK